jgi:predicted dienelactone hydrolase
VTRLPELARQIRLGIATALGAAAILSVVPAAPTAAQADPAAPAAASSDPQQPGEHPVGYVTFTLPDPTRDDRPVELHVWYPRADPGGSRAELDFGLFRMPTESSDGGAVAPGQHPLVLASHGYRALGEQSYRQAEHIASHGYIVAWVTHTGNDIIAFINDTLAGFGQTFMDRRYDLAFAKLVLAGDDEGGSGLFSASIAYEAVGDPVLATMGHSFGAFTAATMQMGTTQPDFHYNYPGDPDIDAVVAIGPALMFAPDPIEVTAPILIIGGKADTITPVETMSRQVWDSSTSLHKFRIDIDGVTHAGPSEVCDFHAAVAVALWNDPTNTLLQKAMTSLHGTADGACDPGALDPDAIRRTVVGYIVPFLDTQLKRDPSARTWLSRGRSNVSGRVLPNDYWRCNPVSAICDTQPS